MSFIDLAAQYLSPLDREQLVCVGVGLVVGFALALAIMHVRAYLKWRRYHRGLHDGRIIRRVRS